MNEHQATRSGDIRDAVVALKRARIIAAAAALFYKHGYESTTLDAIAESLGVTKPFIYSYFKSKSDLLAEICARGIACSLLAINTAVGAGRSPTKNLVAFSEGFVVAVLENQQHIAVFTREEKNLEPRDFRRISEKRREFDRKLIALLDAGVAAGEFDIADTRITSLMIGGMVSWAYIWYRPSGRLDIATIAGRVTDLILGMVRSAAAIEPEVTSRPSRLPPRAGAR